MKRYGRNPPPQRAGNGYKCSNPQFKYRDELDYLMECSCVDDDGFIDDRELKRFLQRARNTMRRTSRKADVNQRCLLMRFVIEAEERPPWVVLRPRPVDDDDHDAAPA